MFVVVKCLSCRCSGGCIPSHTVVNETIRHDFVSRGELSAVLEPVRFCHNDGKRPDGVFLIPWWLPFTWDLTSSDIHGLGNVCFSVHRMVQVMTIRYSLTSRFEDEAVDCIKLRYSK